MNKLYAIFLLVMVNVGFAQDSKIFFDEAIATHIRPYNLACDLAISEQNYEQVEVLFDSLVKNHLKGTYVQQLKLNKINGGKLNTARLDRPFIIITKSAWYLQKQEEIDAINDLAIQYRDKIEVILLFWDTVENARAGSKQFGHNVTICYVDETKNLSNNVIRAFKHSFGIPSCYFISNTKQIVDIDKSFRMLEIPSSSNDIVQNSTYKAITQMLYEYETKKNTVITISD